MNHSRPTAKVRNLVLAATLLAAQLPAMPAGSDGSGSGATEEIPLSGNLYSLATGRALAGALVEAFPYLDVEETRERHEIGEFDLAPLGRATADRAGRFTIRVPAETRLFVVASAPGHLKTRLGGLMNVSDDREIGSFDLDRGGEIRGNVVDDKGQPLPGATLVARVPREPARLESGFLRRVTGVGLSEDYPVFARSREDGSFLLQGVAESGVVLTAHAPGSAPRVIRDPGRSRDLKIKMTPGSPVEGAVVAPDGKSPVAGAWVLAGDELGSEGAVRSDADGRFKLENMRRGKVPLTAAAPAHRSVPAASSISKGAGSGNQASKANPSVPPELMHAPSAPLTVALPRPGKSEPVVLRLRRGGAVTAHAVDALTRKPLAGATFRLMAGGEIRSREAVTGEEGSVIFSGVPSGKVEMTATADGYFDERLPHVSVAAGQNRSTSAALTPSASVAGVVRDAEGRPVAGVSISVSGPPPASMRIPVKLSFPIGVDPVTSDLQGRFRFDKLPAGKALTFTAASRGYAPWELEDLKLRPGEARKNMEILLDPGTTLRGRLVDEAGEPVAFAAVSATRRPEGGGSAMVVRIAEGRGRRGRPAEVGGMGGESLPEVFSDPRGSFLVGGVKDGVWSLDVTAEGFAPLEVPGIKIDGGSGADLGDLVLGPGATIRGTVKNSSGEPVPFAQVSVRKMFSSLADATSDMGGFFETSDLKPGEIVNLNVSAEGYGSVEIPGLSPPVEKVEVVLPFASSISGQVLDKESREPVTDFQISVSRTRSVGGGGMQMVAQIPGPEKSFQSKDGRFELEGIDPGKISVSAGAGGYKNAVLRDLEVPEGESLDGLTLHLDRAAFVSGTVRDDRGNPVSGAVISKKQTSGGMMGGRAMMVGGGSRATSDGDGQFLLEGLDREPMTLAVTKEGYEPADVDVDTTRDVEGLGIVLSRGVTISGTVLREADGSPVTGAAVSAVPVGSGFMGSGPPVTTDSGGEFVIEGLSSGRYTIKAEAQGLMPAELNDVVLRAGAPVPPLELRLGGGVTLSGRVEGARPDELSNLMVRAVTSGIGGFGVTAPVDASGAFEMKGLSAGNYTLIASTGIMGGRSTSRTIEIPPGIPSMEAVIEFPEGARVEGLVSRGGAPVAGASVVFFKTTSRTTATATTDAAGRYVAEDLDDGEYSVSVMQMERGLSHTTNVTVDGDRSFDIELPLARLTGEVRDATSGEPLQGAGVSIKRLDGPPSRGFIMMGNGAGTDATGYYELDGLEDGMYEVTARKDGFGFLTKPLQIIPGAEPAPVNFDLSPVEGYSFVATDAGSGLPLRSLSAVVLQGGGDPLAPSGFGARVAYRGNLSADASGLFRLASLQPGSYTIVLGGASLATLTLNDVQVPAQEDSITMIAGGDVEVRVPSLSGQETARGVLMDESGRPVHWNTFTGDPSFQISAGSPRTLRGLPPGGYTLRAALPDGAVTEKPVAVQPGGRLQVSLP